MLIAGLAASTSYPTNTGHGYTYVSGGGHLDAPQFTTIQATPQGAIVEKVAIEHELGHLVGLDHVTRGAGAGAAILSSSRGDQAATAAAASSSRGPRAVRVESASPSWMLRASTDPTNASPAATAKAQW